ncbi:MAG: DeoR/GlpR transcriptional regulator [Chloroflexi bacterium]|nr:DeoR/GlpR transcriptional regulator [Chloroflexota bacterium]
MQPRPDRNLIFTRERRDLIARTIHEHGRARVADLSERMHVSTVTIRKDLEALAAEGRIVRAHGGALAIADSSAESAFEVRERYQRAEKDRIGAVAAASVIDGESVALDASTTAMAIARQLRARGGWVHLTVITNGLRIASELAGVPGITVVMPGGFVRWEAMSVVGPLGEGLFSRVNIQRAFMGAAGFTIESGLSDATQEEADIKRLMTTHARQVIGVIDHTKWERAAFATFCSTQELTTIISDAPPAGPTVDALRRFGIELTIAGNVGEVARARSGTRRTGSS